MFSNQQLQDLISGKIVGDRYPYYTKNEHEIETHIKRLFHRINRIPKCICEAEWDHFGSGYASFVEFFCYRKEDVIVKNHKYGIREIEINGIIIDICRLAPVAIMGEDDRYRTIRIETNEEIAGGHGTLLDGPHRLQSKDRFNPLVKELEQALREFDYKLLNAEEIKCPLPFKSEIRTIYRDPGEYLVMDAIFYWED